MRPAASSVTQVTVYRSAGCVTEMTIVRMIQMKTLDTVVSQPESVSGGGGLKRRRSGLKGFILFGGPD